MIETNDYTSEAPRPRPDLPSESVVRAGHALLDYVLEERGKSDRPRATYRTILHPASDRPDRNMSALAMKSARLQQTVAAVIGSNRSVLVSIVLDPDMYAEAQQQTGLPFHNFHTDYTLIPDSTGLLKSPIRSASDRYGMTLNGQGTEFVTGTITMPVSEISRIDALDGTASGPFAERILAAFPGYVLGRDDHLLRAPVDRNAFAAAHTTEFTRPNAWYEIDPTSLHAVPLLPDLGRMAILVD